MKAGDKVMTPRFLTVAIKKVFDSIREAREAGFKEPTHYENSEYAVFGKSIDIYHMEFAAAKK